ncbi:thermostable hemolysin [Thalassospira sp. MCCC 1A01428]|uniref:thermostable hemolysin n=1 Tax=Thalassospira sp. MCCC 1A01428 TaxID=1470575 RepID=UPI000A1D6254|nr:thermostable hemolysin [Thalassospira sp. MCCC 1A01428]OSQ43487.1 hypothetical protein THS27_10890 [Thalassospira sp. MCCC 1A01428]
MLNLTYTENGIPAASMTIKKRGFLDHLQMHAGAISILSLLAAERPEVETFIANIYADTYDAALKVQYSNLMSVRDDTGRIVAALGFRSAGHGPIFLEQYLSAPVEDVLGVARHQIVEIGNLAASGTGASAFLFAALSAYLHHNGFTHAIVTGTASLEKRLHKMGLNPQRHATADPSRLADTQTGWGRYYATCPHVLSGSVADGYQRLQTRLGAHYTHVRPRLHLQLKHNGEG